MRKLVCFLVAMVITISLCAKDHKLNETEILRFKVIVQKNRRHADKKTFYNTELDRFALEINTERAKLIKEIEERLKIKYDDYELQEDWGLKKKPGKPPKPPKKIIEKEAPKEVEKK